MSGPWLTEVLDAAVAAHSSRIAVHDEFGSVTYAEFASRIADARVALTRVDVQPGDRVLIAATDPTNALVALFASLGAEATCELSPSVEGEGVERFTPTVVATAARDALAVERVAPPAVDDALPAGLVVCSSGTTGRRKAVLHTHETIGHAVRTLQLLRAEVMGLDVELARDDDALRAALVTAAATEPLGLVYFGGMPVWTIAGLTIVFQALFAGDTIALRPAFDARDFLDTIASVRATNVSLSPFMAQLLLRTLRNSSGCDTNSLGYVGIGGGLCPPRVAAGLEDALSVPLAVGYGTTETAGALAIGRVTDTREVRHTTIGRPLPGVEMSISGAGALSIRTPALAFGYIDRGRVVHTLPGAREWWDTSDRAGWQGDEIVVLGRVDDTIVRGARAVDPVALEHVLEEDPDVERAAVVGVPSRVAGEQDVCALVVARADPDVRALRRRCRDRFGVAPQHVLRVGELPLTDDGAVRRHLLAALASGLLEDV